MRFEPLGTAPRAGRRQRRVNVKVPGPALVLAAIALLSSPGTGAAGDLKDVISELYGGDGLTLAPVDPSAGLASAFDFTQSATEELDLLGSDLTANLGVFSFNSTTTPTFTFDLERGVPVKVKQSLGPLLAERPTTIGEGRLGIAASYTRIAFKQFEGRSLDDLFVKFEHQDVNGDGVLAPFDGNDIETDFINVDLDTEIQLDVFAAFVTYGLTSNWDVGVVVPIIHARVAAAATAEIVENNTVLDEGTRAFNPDVDPPTSSGSGEATGLGDIILKSKYNFLRKRAGWPDLAVVGEATLPTGDEDNLLGAGHGSLLGLLVAAKTFDWLTPHINAGYEVAVGEPEQSNVPYIAGFDAIIHDQVTVALDLLGRWEPNGDGIGDHIVDVAFGAKWNPFDTFIVSASAQVPINKNSGLRPDVVLTFGIEYTF